MDICNENVPHKKIYLNLSSNKVAIFTRSNFTSDEALPDQQYIVGKKRDFLCKHANI